MTSKWAKIFVPIASVVTLFSVLFGLWWNYDTPRVNAAHNYLHFPTTARSFDVSSVNVTTSTADSAWVTSDQFQRKVFNAAGRMWVFYQADFTNASYRTSTDNGATWSTPTVWDSSSMQLGTEWGWTFDGTHFHYARDNGYNLYYRMGTPQTDGTITWAAAEQTIIAGSDWVMYPNVIVDSSGNPWIGYTIKPTDFPTHGATGYVTKSSTSNGTWTTDTGFPYTFDANHTTVLPAPVGCALTSGKTYWICTADNYTTQPLIGRLYNSGWGSAENATPETNGYTNWSVVEDGDDLHLVYFSWDGINPLKYYKRTYGVGWGNAANVSATDGGYVGVVGCTGSDSVAVVWTNANHIYYRLKTSGVWDEAVDWIDESTDTMATALNFQITTNLTNNLLGFAYVTKASSPYTVKFASLTIGGAAPTSTIFSPSGNSGYWINPTYAYSSDNLCAYRNPTTIVNDSPTNTTNGANPWTNPTNAFASDNNCATATVSNNVSQNPTANTNGTNPWTNPQQAYTINGSFATAVISSITVSRNASSLGSGNFTNPTFAYTQNSQNASAPASVGAYQDYKGYGFAIPATANITRVVVNWYGFVASGGTGATVNLQISSTGNASFYGTHAVSLDTTNQAHNIDVTGDAAWTPAMFNTDNCCIRVNRTAGNRIAYLDWIPVIVTYQVEDDQIYKTFDLTGTAAISKVELGYSAYSSNASQKLSFYDSINGGSTFSSNHTTAALATSDPAAYTYIDITGDNSWTWNSVNNTNFQIKVVTVSTNSSPTYYLDGLIVRITYAAAVFDQRWDLFAVNGTGTISKVELGFECWVTGGAGKIDLATSVDAGGTWGVGHTSGALGSNNYTPETFIDITADRSWSWGNLQDHTFEIKVSTNWTSSAPTWNLDWLTVRVTSYVTVNLTHVYTTYGVVFDDETITKLEVGTEAFTTSSENLSLEVTWNGGTNWSANQTTPNLGASDPNTTTWYDFTSATSWTPTAVNNTNFQVRITYVDTGSHGQINLDWLPIRITYTEPGASVNVTPASFAFGVVQPSTTYWAKTGTTPPSFPLQTENCTFLLTNDSGATENITVQMFAWNSSGSAWSIGAPNTNTARLSTFIAGSDSTNGTALTTSPQTFKNGLAAAGTVYFDITLETPTVFSDGFGNNTTIRFTAVLP